MDLSENPLFHKRSMWLLPSLGVRRPSSVRRPSVRPSVNFTHFNLLLRNYRIDLDQTLVEWSLGGPLPKMCPVFQSSEQNGRHG